MRLQSYPGYKNSGADWLGEVPDTWTVGRVKNLFEIRKRIAGVEGLTVLSITQQGIKVKDIDSNDGQLSMDYSKYQIVQPDDFAMNHMDLLTGYIDISKISGVTSPDYRVFSVREPKTCHPRYFLYVFQNAYRCQILYAFGQGSSQLGRWRLPTQEFNDFALPIPPPDEQEEIAAFIAQETAKIDALINEQQQLIELLKEKRQAVITRAVTKGLNPHAPIKDSGAEWIGCVPEHWTVKYLVRLARPGTAVTYGIVQAGPNTENGVPYIRTSDMSGRRLPEEGYLRTTREIDGAYERSRVHAGDIVIAIRATIGKALIVPPYLEGANLTQGTAKFSPSKACDARFMLHFLNSVASVGFDRVAKGATFREITLDMLRKAPICCPPLEEQFAIADFLESECCLIDALTADAERAISLLLERRTALISAAVTGKIDVRGVASASTPKIKPYSTGFARQLLAAEILHHCHRDPTMGRVKLQKLIHLCEHVAKIDEIGAEYQRKAAGPFDNKVMFGIASGLAKQGWFSEVREGSRTVYTPLRGAGGHKKYLAQWESKLPGIHYVLSLLGTAKTQQCEIVSTLYAAWNDLLIEGRSPSEAEIIREASAPDRWHENKSNIAPEKWIAALGWMREKKLVPSGWGQHTKREVPASAGQSNETQQSGTRQQ